MLKGEINLDEISQEITATPFKAIDNLLEVIARTNHAGTFPHTPELLTLFSQAVLLSQNVDEHLWKNDPRSGLFLKQLGFQTRHFIGVCLLRLLALCDQCFQADTFRHRVFDLFDDVFVNDLYKSCNINKNDQTYVKESRLKDVVPSVEREISTTISSLSTLDSLAKQTFRKSFMSALMSPKAQIIVLPFLPQISATPLTVRLNEIFGLVESYLKESESGLLHAFERAREQLSSYIEDVEQYGTKYGRDYIGGVIEKLLELIERHFENSPISKPARLAIMKMEKKYPLSAARRSFNIGITISNEGPGYAFDVVLKVVSDLSLRRSEIYIGPLAPTSTIIDIPAYVDKPMSSAEIMVEISWANFDKTQGTTEALFELEGQRTDIDWESLREDNPYDLEPVSTENELVGRTEILNKLIAQSKARSVGSSFIYGQKRVGKTSIVKTLKTRLTSPYSASQLVVYLEMGDCIDPDAKTTIKQLGKRLCREIQRANANFSHLSIPEFEGALSPFSDFLESILDIDPDYKILFILDEFDEIPKEMYRRSSIGDAFFLTIRSISSKPSFGFILVGGEKMEYLLSNQGDKLNKFDPVRVDYFDSQKHRSDFRDLVQKPVSPLLEISDAAFSALHDRTAGNPYFTKLICRSLFKLLVDRRDCHVTRKEVEEATRQALQTVASNSFQHFWEDGIVDTEERVEERTMIRRQVLIALAEALKNHPAAPKSAILESAVKKGLTERDTERELQDFVRRQILIVKDDAFQCKVPFFSSWLQEKGIREIITRYVDPDQMEKYKQDEAEAFIRAEEIINLLNNAEFYYKGKIISDVMVRAWLNQFSTNIEQRHMFRILQHLTCYNHSAIRHLLDEAHQMVRADSIRYMRQRERKRDDILVSYLDGPGKSGATYASLYAEQASITKSNVIERSKLKNTLFAIARRPPMEQPHSLVFIDDFIGTGESAGRYFRQLNSICGDLLRTSKLRVFFIALSGFEQGKQKIEETLEGLNLIVQVRVCDLLDEVDKCFSESSKIFRGSLERETAKNIVYKYGATLVPDHPLGFGGCQAIVAFEDSCPNNTLPIIWSDAHNWIPLFKRD